MTAHTNSRSFRPSTRDCAYAADGRCTHPEQPYGARPTRAVCLKFCTRRTRWRGLGDLVHWALGFLPSRKVKQMQLPVAQGGCGGCKQRQDALNAAVPFGKCGSCAEKRESAQGS